MFTLVTGAAASGKSEFAESLIIQDPNPKRFYIATMELWDEECQKRAQKHQRNRGDKGFTTLECPRALHTLTFLPQSAVLLECLSNLTANECFGPQGFSDVEQRILQGIAHIRQQAQNLVVVSNEVFSDGILYPSSTQRYLHCLAALNRVLAEQADSVIEVVAGLPIYWKGAKK